MINKHYFDMKYYFRDNTEGNCYELDYHYDYMADEGIKEMILYPAIIEYNNGWFYCQEIGECGESGLSDCGRECKQYEPRNGKSGRCRFHRSTYIAGDPVTIILPKSYQS